MIETLVLHELRTHVSLGSIGGRIRFWRTPAGKEIDFIWSRGQRNVGIEVKSASRWRPGWGKALTELHESGALDRAFGVYLGDEELADAPVRVLPFSTFARQLHEGSIIP